MAAFKGKETTVPTKKSCSAPFGLGRSRFHIVL